jgi:hypothetical protein
MEYDYPKLIRKRSRDLQSIEGQVLEKVLVHVVEPEYIALSLKFPDGWYTIKGEIGSEILGFHKSSGTLTEYRSWPMSWLGPYQPFEVFIGKKVASTRHIGNAWNGHGFEISFEEVPEKTLIVQSIYTAPKPSGFDDCLRLGIGNYSYSTEGT